MTRKLRKMQVAERYGNLNTRTIDRWLTYPDLNFPRPVYINSIPYWDESDLETWERTRARQRVRCDPSPERF